MAGKSCLGVHYNELGLTAVLAAREGNQSDLSQNIKIVFPKDTPPVGENAPAVQLARQLRGQSSQKLPPTVLTLGGRFYQTQIHHTEFTDDKQISQTLRYDVEEDFAQEAGDLAFCYQPYHAGGEKPGSDLLVHAARRDDLNAILKDFETADLDPLRTLPDVAAWLYFLNKCESLPQDKSVALAAWTPGMAYILILDDRHQPLLARSYCCLTSVQATELLALELCRSIGALPHDRQAQELYYHSEGLGREQLAHLGRMTGLEPKPLQEADVTRAMARGAALSWLEDIDAADFRKDGLTPRTVLRQQRRAWLSLAAAAAALAAALIIVMQAHNIKFDRQYNAATKQIEQAYLSVYPTGKLPSSLERIPRELTGRLRTLRGKSRGPAAAENSAGEVLFLVLDMLNKLPPQFNLSIDTLRVTTKEAQLGGAVPNLQDMEQLFKTVAQATTSLKLENWDTQKSAGGAETERRTFNMSLSVVKEKPAQPGSK